MKTDTTQQNIPNGWKYGELGNFLSDIGDGGTPLRSKSEYFGGDIPWVVVNDIKPRIKQTKDTLTNEGLKKSSAKLWPTGSVILSFGATIGEVGIADVPVTTKQGIAGIIPNDDLLNTYLYYLLLSKKNLLHKLSSGSTIKEVRPSVIKTQIEVLIPPIKEQQKIAEILGTVDEDIAKTQEVINATEKLKRGLMQQLFTRGIGHTKFKETKIGQVPESWDVVPVSDVVKKIVDNRGKTPPLSSDGVGMIEVNAIDSSQKYPNYSRISKYVSQDTYDTWFRSGHPEKGDILIPTVGTVGVAVILNENKGCIAQNIIAVRVAETIFPDFFYYLVISPLFVDQIRKVLMGAVQPSLKVPHMLAFNIPLPTKPEQKEIAEILSAVDEKISTNKKLKEKFTLLKKGLMQDLLSGKVRTSI